MAAGRVGSEVSCVTLGAFFHYLDHLGLDTAALIAGVPYTESHLRTKHARISFHAFRDICERFQRMFPGNFFNLSKEK